MFCSQTQHFTPSPKLCQSTAGCSPPSMSFTVFCLSLSCSRWFPLPCFVVLPFSAWSTSTLDLFPLLGCHSVQRLVHVLSFILAIIYVRPISTFTPVCILHRILFQSVLYIRRKINVLYSEAKLTLLLPGTRTAVLQQRAWPYSLPAVTD